VSHPLTSKLSLKALYFMAMGRAFLRYRNPHRRAVGRAHDAFHERLWRDTAAEIGAACEVLGAGISQLTLGERRTRVVDNVSGIDDPVTLRVAHDKPLTHKLLQARNIPVPKHTVFSLDNLGPAIDFLAALGSDCVIKPANGTGGGRGITTGIRTVGQLCRAAAAAACYADELMIEEQITGDNYRLLYLDGQLLDAYVRRLPSVVGDGRSTIKVLVNRLNEQRERAGTGVSQTLLSIDMDMRRTLAKQGLKLSSIAPAGQTITLKTVVNENGGADNTTVSHLLCRSIIEAGAEATKAVGIRWAGIDVVTTDPTIPLAESGGVILEVNGTPNLYYHYHKQDGVFPAARHLMGALLQAPAAVAAGGCSKRCSRRCSKEAIQCPTKCSVSIPQTTPSSSPATATSTSSKV
jgi:D-alanine-D-alanine ligase-like ATP-grasp enzyme